MAKEDAILDFRFKNKHLLEERKHNELMNGKHKKVCMSLGYFEHFVVLISAVTGCVSVSAFALLVGILFGFASFAVVLNISAITAGI